MNTKNQEINVSQRYSKDVSMWCVIVFVLAMVSTGCETYHDVDAFMLAPQKTSNPIPYTIDPPDVLIIRAVQVPEINNGAVIVQPDGHVNLPLLGELYVSGLTPKQVAKAVEAKAKAYYEDVDVVVQVAEYRSKHLYVFGEVGAPGRYSYTGSDTVLDILSRAQPSRLADPNRIQVYRRSADGKSVKKMTIQLDRWVKGGAIGRNTVVAEGDMIYVPANGLAKVGLTVQQLSTKTLTRERC